MLNKKKLTDIIFLDIETTSQYPRFEDMPPELKTMFLKRFRKEIKEANLEKDGGSDTVIDYQIIEEIYSRNAPIHPEWGKIVCISALRVVNDIEYKYKTLSLTAETDKDILEAFLNKFPSISNEKVPEKAKDFLCAHAGLFFDFPFISKRMIINGIIPPPMFDFAESKPWERTHLIDTMAVWSFGSNNNVSMELMCHIFGVQTPKTDISGADVKDVFWIEKDLKRISDYCEQDVLALATCYLRIKGIKNNLTK
jgi:hypothetical protein